MSAQEAIRAIEAREVEVVLLDVTQRSADVFAVLKAAIPGTRGRGRAEVIVTGPAGVNDRLQACLARGAADYLFTPFDTANPFLVVRRFEAIVGRIRQREATVRISTTRKKEDSVLLRLHNDASRRFVPREFLDLLGRESLADLQLGDHVSGTMTVLFSDIRNFTRLSEAMTPTENFEFLNSYLKNVTPIIRTHHGFIDKYIGDAIMALFPDKAVDALEAAVALLRQVGVYNTGRKSAGYVPIRIGIGLHRGDVILGTIGEEHRMETTVIADAVNVASRMEGLTKVFGVDLLVSGGVVDALPKGHGIPLRHLGAVKAKGKTQSVEIYECYSNDAPQLLAHKEQSKALFSQAMGEFRKGMFLTAGKMFARVAELSKLDAPAAYFRDACSLSIVRPRSAEPWDGAEVVEVK
uniref:Two-component hybrid sensor and regulator n=1 Tax=mine drainage metagenome TaxID=410659 RepID=E6PE38_9ZZZZ